MRFNRLDLNLLLALDALLEEQNITRAAARVNVSQSAMSGMLARLREFFEDDLLAAVGRNMELTVLGRQLVGPVRDLILHVHATVGIRVSFDPARETRCMKIMVSDYATEVFLNKVVARVLRDAPNMTLELVPLADDAGEKLRRGENDFLIIPRNFLDPEHPQRLLFEDHYCAVIWEGNTQVGDTLDAATYEAAVAHRADAGPPALADGGRTDAAGPERQAQDPRHDLRFFQHGHRAGRHRPGRDHAHAPGAGLRARLPIRVLPLPYQLPVLAECLQWHRFQENDPCHIWLRGIMLEVARGLPMQRQLPMAPLSAGRDQDQIVRQGQQQARQHRGHRGPQHVAPAQPVGAAAGPYRAEDAEQVQQRNRADHALAQAERCAEQAETDEVVGADEAAHQQESQREQPGQAAVAEMQAQAVPQGRHAARRAAEIARNGQAAPEFPGRQQAGHTHHAQRHAPGQEVRKERGQHAPDHAAEGIAADVQAHRDAQRFRVDLFAQVGHGYRRHAAQRQPEQGARGQQLGVVLRKGRQQGTSRQQHDQR
jgi:LysR family nod box-dependent transcriptional activator